MKFITTSQRPIPRRLSRRTVLTGMAAMAAVTLTGCGDDEGGGQQTQTGDTDSGTAGEGGTGGSTQPEATGDGRPAQPEQQVSKETANYQEQPSGEEMCANCANFIASSSECKVVTGKVAPTGWCKFWTKAG